MPTATLELYQMKCKLIAYRVAEIRIFEKKHELYFKGCLHTMYILSELSNGFQSFYYPKKSIISNIFVDTWKMSCICHLPTKNALEAKNLFALFWHHGNDMVNFYLNKVIYEARYNTFVIMFEKKIFWKIFWCSRKTIWFYIESDKRHRDIVFGVVEQEVVLLMSVTNIC